MPGPDGLCTMPGCGRVRAAHIEPSPFTRRALSGDLPGKVVR
jgi:hypothetical protein